MKLKPLFAACVVALALLTPTAHAALPGQPNGVTQSAEGHGWRFRTGNICVQDWTGGVLSDGIKRAVVAWSKADDVNLYYRRNCTAAGFSQSQTITIVTYAWDTYDGACGKELIWTEGGYRVPGYVITRAVLHVNRACNIAWPEDRAYLAAHGIGHALGLTHPTRSDSVMAYRWLPTAWDHQRIEQVYPW